MLSCPSTVNAPSSVAKSPTLIVSSASAIRGANATPASRTRARVPCVFMCFLPGLKALLGPRGTRFPRFSRFAQWLLRQGGREAPPQTQNSVWRNEDDDEKNGADQRIESVGADEVDREGLQHHIERRAEERPDRVPEPADDRDDQNADGLADADRAWRNAAVEPDVEHAGRPRD